MSSTDLESLESGAARSRCRRMDACLVGSVLALFVLTVAGFVLALLFALNLKSEMDSIKKRDITDDSPTLGSLHADIGSGYKAQSFAYLRATNSELKQGVMEWESISYGSGKTVGSGYTYDPDHRALTVKREGSYFLYTQLKLSCVYQCENGSLTLTFESQGNSEQLSCTVKLPANHSDDVVQKCWTVIPHLEQKSRLLARISSNKSLKNWQLDLNSSGFGIFLVDGLEKE
ncbi:uncharacterized protein LOC118798189 [Colossoma macropomum]|uniref:uncharacterized protein LOC118798189 n=1 Tax=Colossoma macropomum TaxID=42526 RepID=UPI001864B7D5|nr:uncharacterized protein LOC118798189 [Colossoma macropomum]XP_036413452.1 uncharacterized protein LOC118798189 [Colossoma macropomum]